MITHRIETAPEIVRQQVANLLADSSMFVLPAFRPRRKRRPR